MARSNWSNDLLQQSTRILQTLEQTVSQISVIKRSVQVAISHLSVYSRNFDQIFERAVDSAVNLDQDITSVADWRSSLGYLDRIKVVDGFRKKDKQDPARNSPARNSPSKSSPNRISSRSSGILSEWIDSKKIEAVYHELESQRTHLRDNLKQLKNQVDHVTDTRTSLERRVEEWISTNDANNADYAYSDTMKDMIMLVKKVQADCDHVSRLSDTSSNVRSALSIAGLHEREFLPEVAGICQELYDKYLRWQGLKQATQSTAFKFLRELSQLQLQSRTVRPQLQSINDLMAHAEANRVTVARVVDLSYLYGVLLIECVRQTTWGRNLDTKVTKTAEMWADLREEEVKRRSKWRRQFGANLGAVLHQSAGQGDAEVSSVEINLNTPFSAFEKIAKNITREDVVAYLGQLEALSLIEEHQALSRQLSEYDRWLQAQSEQSNSGNLISSVSGQSNGISVFKGQSISNALHELQPSDATLNAYQTRIRKLEDLLHRQQISENTSKGIVFSSSAVLNNDGGSSGGKLVERIHILEMQNKQLQSQRDDLKAQLEESKRNQHEAEMTKADLLANMAAQEGEFSQDRRNLSQEISELKLRIEELEEELEREVEKTSDIDQKHSLEIAKLDAQVDKLRVREHEVGKGYEEEMNKLSEQSELLKKANSGLESRIDRYNTWTQDLSQRLYTSYTRICEMLERLGLQLTKELGPDGEIVSFKIQRVKGLGRRSSKGEGKEHSPSSGLLDEGSRAEGTESTVSAIAGGSNSATTSNQEDNNGPSVPKELYWMYQGPSSEGSGDSSVDSSDELFNRFINTVYIDHDMLTSSISNRFADVEHLARKLQKESRSYRERAHVGEKDSRYKLAYKGFKQGDLALFLPTRDQSRDPNPWAAFNVGAPHYFLKQQEHHQLANREWLVARITKIEERVVNRADEDDDNPFDLSDGLRWHLLEAEEERV